jgi:hypothetical protein
MKPAKIAADLAQEVEANQIIALYTLEYETNNTLATHPDFVWRYSKNPAGRAIIPVVRDEHNHIVGFIWVVPIVLRIRGENLQAATATHLLIHPEYRDSFGYTKLIRRFQQVLRDHHIPLHYSFINEYNYRHLRSRASQTADTIPFLIKPLDVKALMDALFSRKWKRFIGRLAGGLASPLFLGKLDLIGENGIAVRAVDHFDTRFDEFWRQTADTYPAMAIRNRAFLSWRFAPVSGRQYHILVAEQGGRMLGYVVIRCRNVRGVKTGLILDLLVCDHPLKMEAGACLMLQAEAFFRTQGMSIAAGLMLPQAAEYRILKKSGYRPLPAAISPRPYRFAFFVHDAARESLQSLSMKDWFVTFADFESH